MKLERTVIDGTPVIGIAENLEIDVGNCQEFQRRFLELVEESGFDMIFRTFDKLDAARAVSEVSE